MMDAFADDAWNLLQASSLREAAPEFPPVPGSAPAPSGAERYSMDQDEEYLETVFESIACTLPRAARQVISTLEERWGSRFTNTDAIAYMVNRPPGAIADELAIQFVDYLASEIPDEYPEQK